MSTSMHRDVRQAWRDALHKDPDELEHEIDETRAELEATLDVLERKLSPEHLLDLTVDRVRAHGGEFAGNLGHSLKQNPLPMLLTSIGIAWMMLVSRQSGDAAGPHSSDRHRIGGRFRSARNRLHDAADRTRERVEQSREDLTDAAENIRAGAERASTVAREGLSRARSRADSLLHEQPLMLGALGIAAGALIGAMLPETEEEDRVLGPARDRALDHAREAGRDAYRKTRERAEHAVERMAKEVREQNSGDAGDAVTSSAPRAAAASGDSDRASETPPM